METDAERAKPYSSPWYSPPQTRTGRLDQRPYFVYNIPMARYREVDAARGVAIIAMIVFHTFYTLEFLQLLGVEIHGGFWWYFARFIAASFLGLVGISLTLSYNKVKDRLDFSGLLVKFGLRSLLILGMGFIITAVTWIGLPHNRMVLFGILHLIGVSVFMGFFLVRFTWANLAVFAVVLSGGIVLGEYRFDFPWLLWLGFRPMNYYPVDYLPLLPWFSFVALGIFTGNILYRDGKRRFPLPDLSKALPVRILEFIGRHSLVIYLFHIPVIYGILFLIKTLLNL